MSTDKKISFQEFKAWLQGVEEMQDEGWTPTGVQWQKIKEKLNQIDFHQPTLVYPPNVRTHQPQNIQVHNPADNFVQDFDPPPMQSRLSGGRPIQETMDHETFVQKAIPRDQNGAPYTSNFR